MNLGIWFLILIAQNAAFTWVSRARNSGSIWYHALAAVFSNGIWFVSQLIMIATVIDKNMTTDRAIQVGAVYIAGTVIGSVLMHFISMRFLESGRRKVGA